MTTDQHRFTLSINGTDQDHVTVDGVDVTDKVAVVDMRCAPGHLPHLVLHLHPQTVASVEAMGLVTVEGTPADRVAALDRQAIHDAYNEAMDSMGVRPEDAMVDAIVAMLR